LHREFQNNEETILKENENMYHTRTLLRQHKAELEEHIKSSKQAEIDIHNVKKAGEIVETETSGSCPLKTDGLL